LDPSTAHVRKPVVFYVDDEAALRRFVQRQLDERGFETLVAGSASEAVEVGEGHTGRIDALLMDINLPDGWGSVVAQRLRAGHPEMAVIYTTGFAESDPILSGGLNDAEFVLPKPFTVRRLVETINKAIEEYRRPE
jgi:DNA-binding response OmpR family regulator